MDVSSIIIGFDAMDERTPEWARSFAVNATNELNAFLHQYIAENDLSPGAAYEVTYVAQRIVASLPLRYPVPLGFDVAETLEGVRSLVGLIVPLADRLASLSQAFRGEVERHGWGSALGEKLADPRREARG